MRTDLAGTGPWVSTTGHPFTAGFELRCTFGQNRAFVVGYHHHGSLLPPRFSLIRPNISTNKRAPRARGAPPDTLFFMPCGGVLSFHLLYKCVHRGVLYFYTPSVFYALGLPFFPSLVLLLVLHLSTGSSLCLTMSIVS